MLALMQAYLSGNFSLFLARSAEEALEILQREQMHAVVSDHILGTGKLTGVELLKRVAELQPYAARILVTASRSMEDAQRAINEARVNHFLTKPFTEQELKETLGQAVHNAALAAIRDKMVQELKEQVGLLSSKTARKPAGRAAPEPKGGGGSAGSSTEERLAFHDGLTGLYNHRYFQEALSAGVVAARRHGQKLALVLVDIDRFRRFNLSRSYAEGDWLLRQVARMLVEDRGGGRGQANAEVASRYGGDVFGVILTGADMEKGLEYAERIRRAVEALDFSEEGGKAGGEVTVSAAVAVFPDCAGNEQGLISSAETTLREAKLNGRNRVMAARAF